MMRILYTSIFLLLTSLVYSQKSTLVQNVNVRANELKHHLNKTGDSLILEGERTIYKVEIFNNDFEHSLIVKDSKVIIPLHNIPVGRFVVEAALPDKLIVITLLRNESLGTAFAIKTTKPKRTVSLFGDSRTIANNSPKPNRKVSLFGDSLLKPDNKTITPEKQTTETKLVDVNKKVNVTDEILTVAKKKSSITAKNITLTDNKVTVADNKTSVIDENITLADNKIPLIDKNKNDADNKITVADNKVTANDKTINVADNKTSEIDENITLTDNKITVIDKNKNVADNKTTVADNKVTTNDKKINFADNKTSVIDEKITLTDNKITVIDKNKNDADNKITVADNKTNIINEKITLVDNKTTVIDKNITLADNKTTEIDKKITLIDKKATAANSKTPESDKNLITSKNIFNNSGRRVVESYWVEYESNNRQSSSKLMRLADEELVNKMIKKINLDKSTKAGKNNELTIWEVYDTTKFLKYKLKHHNDFSFDVDCFNIVPFYKTKKDSTNP